MYGRLGIVYDESYYSSLDSFGLIKVIIVYPDYPTIATDTRLVTGDTNCRNPCIIMSQTHSFSDIRMLIMYEQRESSHIVINALACDYILSGGYPFAMIFNIANSAGNNLYPYGVFDPGNQNFLITYS